MAAFALHLALAVVAGANIDVDEGVLVLNSGNFDDALREHELILVEFFAPWCGHCKQLAPEYAKAAGTLAADLSTSTLKLAKVDATATDNKDLGTKYGVEGFPTLKLFRSGKPTNYEGGRQAADIVAYMRKRSGPGYTTLNGVADAEPWLEGRQEDVAVIGFFGDLEGLEAKVLGSVSNTMEDIVFGVTSSDEVANHYGATKPSIKVFKRFDAGHSMTDDPAVMQSETDLAKFLLDESTPLVQVFSQETSGKIFSSDLKTHLLMFADTNSGDFPTIQAAMERCAEMFKGQLLHILMPSNQTDVMNYFNLKSEDLPVPLIINMETGMKQYRFSASEFPDGINEDSLQRFEQSYTDGSLKPYLKSADPEDDADKPVKVIVGSTFEERVMHGGKDVLLEFYAPWCGHCKALAPKFDEVGETFAAVDSVMIAKLDATENDIDHPNVDIQGFPTLKFFPSKDPEHPIDFNGEREVDAMVDFIKKEATTKFELDGSTHGRDEL